LDERPLSGRFRSSTVSGGSGLPRGSFGKGSTMDTSFLALVSKPTRYTGGEVNQVVKDEIPGLIHAAIAFPDGYEIAMSSVGLAILYSVLNASPHVWAERVFMPMPDMADEMEKRGIPLFSRVFIFR